ncbi:hypothetical protein GEU84_011625 [Fertoebacter nigrum]|uniref:Uncharacterized protein n=1 Tax=Fertoeibacter niger TaxID=2656921 RepID=A0A8X8GVD0_9RHOB|nr:hypothetical protein [Fertoeibacter niger]NUB45039.1 hypothetical protein [Fertoeibacter niger]
MTYPQWPGELTKFERSGWQMQLQDARQRRQSDAGPPGYRRRFSAAARMVAASLIVDQNERAIFDRFYAVTVAQGARMFWMPDPTTDGQPLLMPDGTPLLTGAGEPLLIARRWLVLFGDPPPAETIHQQVQYRKSFSLVVLP